MNLLRAFCAAMALAVISGSALPQSDRGKDKADKGNSSQSGPTAPRSGGQSGPSAGGWQRGGSNGSSTGASQRGSGNSPASGWQRGGSTGSNAGGPSAGGWQRGSDPSARGNGNTDRNDRSSAGGWQRGTDSSARGNGNTDRNDRSSAGGWQRAGGDNSGSKPLGDWPRNEDKGYNQFQGAQPPKGSPTPPGQTGSGQGGHGSPNPTPGQGGHDDNHGRFPITNPGQGKGDRGNPTPTPPTSGRGDNGRGSGLRGGTDGQQWNPGGIRSKPILKVGDDGLLYKKNSHNTYGSNNNVMTARDRVEPISIDHAPPHIIIDAGQRHNPLHPKGGLYDDGWRRGYCHYDWRWCDDFFWFGFYCFEPWGHRCVVSPWYYYPCLPGYFSYDRCRFYSFDAWDSWYGDSYYYHGRDGYGYNGRFGDIDYVLDDIVNAFEQGDRRAVGRLIPQNSDVAIYIDGRYSYSLGPDDFYDMLMDAVQNTKTIRYSISEVKTNRDSVRVTARHEYEDPWGRRTSVYHYYELRPERNGLVITRFGVSGSGRW